MANAMRLLATTDPGVFRGEVAGKLQPVLHKLSSIELVSVRSFHAGTICIDPRSLDCDFEWEGLAREPRLPRNYVPSAERYRRPPRRTAGSRLRRKILDSNKLYSPSV